MLGYFWYLFELDHDVFRELHVLKHPFKLASEGCATFCKTTNITALKHPYQTSLGLNHSLHFLGVIKEMITVY